ncbi:restriction endonuclease subunit S [uncultured Psychrobacter sp.]|jgi:restriction endonuclease S subunit|uniref:restriction endonuclease subunit S n=2 Tax=uncultured Psychrobacter sp. TaxID=259303 RepID=UPI0026263CFF|nr:restriction endonuclease subunit S [uncultured Psychrobacter sp.]
MSDTLLQSTSFSSLPNWSVQYLLQNTFSYNDKYDLVRIGDFLTRNKTTIIVEDDKTYKRVTIKINNGGVYLRDIEKGINIGTKNQYLAQTGQFIFSRIDARNGAFGIIPEQLNSAIVTNDFPIFDIDPKRVNAQFLVLIATTPQFIQFAQSCSSGTTNRQRIDVDLFLEQKIPLPTLDEQNRLINSYNKKIALAKQLETQALAFEQSIEEYLVEQLGIERNKEIEKKEGLAFVSFANTKRWDTLFLVSNIPTINSDFPLINISNIIDFFNKDISGEGLRINSTNFPQNEYYYIGMENIEKGTGNIIDVKNVKGKEIKSQTLKVPKGFFIYGKLRPYLNKYWFNDTEFKNIICSSEFFVFKLKTNINTLFFKYIISSFIIQMQISDKTSGARMPRINEDTFMSLQIPLPPLPSQQEIATHISTLKQQITHLKEQARQNRHEAITDFEKEIFTV